ncbi:MAG TPA: hypothetical protein DCS24_10010 [Erythrobacter sp.]|nr:hypothetical protein [Erythrobacter sp.]
MGTRKQLRQAFTVKGYCRARGGMRASVILSDLGEAGCRIAGINFRLARGEGVELYFAETGPHSAQVRWQRNGETGVSFVQSLP